MNRVQRLQGWGFAPVPTPDRRWQTSLRGSVNGGEALGGFMRRISDRMEVSAVTGEMIE